MVKNNYCTIKVPRGLVEKVKEAIKHDDSYLSISDYIRHAIRKMLTKN